MPIPSTPQEGSGATGSRTQAPHGRSSSPTLGEATQPTGDVPQTWLAEMEDVWNAALRYAKSRMELALLEGVVEARRNARRAFFYSIGLLFSLIGWLALIAAVATAIAPAVGWILTFTILGIGHLLCGAALCFLQPRGNKHEHRG